MKNAIEAFAKDDNAAAKADGDKAIEKLFNSRSILGEMPQEEINELKNTVREIFDTCTSADAREILCKNIVPIVLRGDDSIRGKEEIKAKADAIKANFRELRTVANGNRQILKAGKLLLNSLAGKSLPPGRIAALTAYATGKDAKLDAIKRLKPSSGIVSITKALIQVAKNIKAAFATNDIKSLKAKICDKGLAERTIMRSEVMKLHLINKDEEAYEILNDALYNEARRLYRTTNDEKDYKEMVFMQGEGESRKVSCAEYFEKKWKQMQEKYQPLYDAISHDIPEGLKTVSYDYIRQFGKGENLKKE